MRFTAIYNNHRYNYQIDYSNNHPLEDLIKRFKQDMENKDAKWGHLFQESDGKLIVSYNK